MNCVLCIHIYHGVLIGNHLESKNFYSILDKIYKRLIFSRYNCNFFWFIIRKVQFGTVNYLWGGLFRRFIKGIIYR